jgi:galactose-1-phosphate uridylyltransferase
MAVEMADAFTPDINLDETREQMTREIEKLKQEQSRQLAELKEQGAKDLDWAIRSGASASAVQQIDANYARLIAAMSAEHNKTLNDFMTTQERQLNQLKEQKYRYDHDERATAATEIQRGVDAVTTGIVRSIETQSVVQNFNVSVVMNNPIVRDDANVRTLIRQIRTEVRREMAYK